MEKMPWWRCVDAGGEGEAALGSSGAGARTAAAAQGRRWGCLIGGGGCRNSEGDDDSGIGASGGDGFDGGRGGGSWSPSSIFLEQLLEREFSFFSSNDD